LKWISGLGGYKKVRDAAIRWKSGSEVGVSPIPEGFITPYFHAVAETSVILLVEDREDDVVLVRRALAKVKMLNPLMVVRAMDGYWMWISKAPRVNRPDKEARRSQEAPGPGAA
jgi:hypothetical protein